MRYWSVLFEMFNWKDYQGCFMMRRLLCLVFISAHLSIANAAPSPIEKQRSNYDLATKAWEDGDLKRYRALKESLKSYPLYPYLEYNELKASLSTVTSKQIDAFLEEHTDSYLGIALRKRWLAQLASREKWQDYKKYYQDQVKTDTLACWQVWAEYKTGDQSALKKAGDLWTVGKSMPDECNPLFKEWQSKIGIDAKTAWERHKLAVQNGEKGLAKYIRGLLPKKEQALAELHSKVIANTKTLENKGLFTGDEAKLKEIVLEGLYKQAYRNPLNTLSLWKHYKKSLSIDSASGHPILNRVAISLLWSGNITQAENIYNQYKLGDDKEVIEEFVRFHLKRKQWQDVANWLGKLNKDDQSSDYARYWLARALENGAKLSKENITANDLYTELAKERSYYGFLAADKVKQPYSLAHKPVNASDELIALVYQKPGIQRAQELFILGKRPEARAEWYTTIDSFSKEELTAAASLTNQWGWHRQSIETMAKAQYWDDVNIRFPVVYETNFLEASRESNGTPTLLMAIARQESALLDDAISPVGAMGLMQVMPATAKETAKKAGIEFKNKDELLDPPKNIKIGAHYVHLLLEEFDQNRVLAIAAYNAGPHRVRTWLSRSKKSLEHDIWVEAIPFNETRKYVKNVLAYSVIYSHQLGKPLPLMTSLELGNTL